MKRISDYKDDSSIDLWAELLEPMSEIFSDEEVINGINEKKSMLSIIASIFKNHKEASKKFMLAVDDTELDGGNVFTRFMVTFIDVLNNKDFVDFFKQAEQMKTDSESFGFATANTEVKEN